MLVQYLFVYFEKNGTFPVRLRVRRDGEDSDIPDADLLTGNVGTADVEALMARLRQEYPSPEFRVAKSWANSWQAVARNYAGLDYDHFSASPPKQVEPSPPSKSSQETAPKSHSPTDKHPSSTPSSPPTQPSSPSRTRNITPDPTTPHPDSMRTHPSAGILMETSGSKGTKAYNLAGAVLFFGAVLATWPEFSARFGGLFNWFRALAYNPSWALPGIMVPLCLAAGAYALYWFFYYSRVSLRVYGDGIQVLPNGRFVNWSDVEHIRYAFRTMRFAGTPRQALRLEVRDGRPVNLPHKFDEMEQLVALVRDYVDPVVLRKVKERFQQVGRVSFGKHITITPEHLALDHIGVSVPLAEVGRVGIVDGTFQVTNMDGRVIFSRAVESIPDATVISGLVAALKRPAVRQAT